MKKICLQNYKLTVVHKYSEAQKKLSQNHKYQPSDQVKWTTF